MGCTIKYGRVMDQSGCKRCYVTCDEGYYSIGSIAYCNKTAGKWLDPMTNLPPCYLRGPPIKMVTFPTWKRDTISPWILQNLQHIPTFTYPSIKIPQYHQQTSGSQTGGFGRVIGAAFGVLFLLCAIPAWAKRRKSRSRPVKETSRCSTTEARRRQDQIWVERETRMSEVHIEELQREDLLNTELQREGHQREELQREDLHMNNELQREGPQREELQREDLHMNKELQREGLQREDLLNKELQREVLQREEMQREELLREEQRSEELKDNGQGQKESFGSAMTDCGWLNTEDQSNDVQVHWSAFLYSPELRGFPLPPPYDAESVVNPVYEMSESMDLGLTHKPISEPFQSPSDPDNEHSNGLPEATLPPYSEKYEMFYKENI